MEIHSLSDKNEALQQAGSYVSALFEKYPTVPVLFMASGGSAMEVLSYIDSAKLPQELTLSVLDERFSQEPDQNNFEQLMETEFFLTALQNHAQTIDTTVVDNETGEQHAARFQAALQKWREDNPNGLIIATMGMGPDGHVSGIMPFPENPQMFQTLFEDPETWVRFYNAGEKNSIPQRSTTTIPFLKQIDYAIAFISGEDKKSMVQKMQQEGPLAEVPARLFQHMNDVQVFTDIV